MQFPFPLVYPTIEDAIELHATAMRLSGDAVTGADPQRIQLLESALHHIQNDNYYRSIEEKITHLLFAACKFHGFLDGNKRLTIALGAKFLNDNGFDPLVPRFFRFMENVVVCVAEGTIEKPFLGEIVIAFLNGEEEDEDLKLKILDALARIPPDQ